MKLSRGERREVVKAIRVIWLSFESHLDDCVEPEEKKPCCRRAVGSGVLHRECVREYAQVISVLASFLK